jgi:hypothetical protein
LVPDVHNKIMTGVLIDKLKKLSTLPLNT